MIETSGYSFYTHLQKEYLGEKEFINLFAVLEICRFNFTAKIRQDFCTKNCLPNARKFFLSSF
jgi:hypothetical protein